MPTGNICSSTRRLFVPTRIPPTPKKSQASGNRPLTWGTDHQAARGGRCPGQSLARHPLGRTDRRYRTGRSADQGSACRFHRRQQGKGYGSDAFVTAITAQGSQAVIPPRSNRLNPHSFDRHLYKVAIWSNASLLVSSISDVAPPATIHSPRPSCPSFIPPVLSSAWLG